MKYCEINLKFEGINEGYMINISIVCGFIYMYILVVYYKFVDFVCICIKC